MKMCKMYTQLKITKYKYENNRNVYFDVTSAMFFHFCSFLSGVYLLKFIIDGKIPKAKLAELVTKHYNIVESKKNNGANMKKKNGK